ncbi:hypothetical protein [Halobacterium litoreum]|uniref:Uncharacterized protein n=1 Tax=Halobacterium litoreum TaxID=2039234 RepID=A0ABD5NEE2_9EURY|nr:hypothetical protein [Halobacterium litoreum]UHH13479.1 hypothetical protein LT972_00440 [Halobacterium litoreum]
MLIDLLPTSLAALIPELSLLLIGYVVEKHYVSRVTCFTNVLALNVHFLTVGESGLWLGLYADLGLLLGAWGFLHYMEQESLSRDYYQVSHILYSSLVVGAIILYPHIEWIFSAILGDGSLPAIGVVGIAVLINLALLDDEDQLHYRLARDIRVNEFIVNSPTLEVDLGDGYFTRRHLEDWFRVK